MKAVFPRFVCHRQAVLPLAQLRAPRALPVRALRRARVLGSGLHVPAVSAETAHDAAGNQLRDFNDNFQLGYDAAGRLARMSYGNSSAFQFYDLNGQRIFKTDSQGDHNFNTQNPAGSLNPSTAGVFYQYDPNGNLLWQQTVGGASTGFLEHETATHYYWLPNEHGDILIGFDQGINSYAVYTDHLNTPRLVTKIENPQNPKPSSDTSNDLPQVSYGEPEGISPLAIPVWQWSYSPFGADLANGYEARPTTIANNFKPELWTWVGLPETGGGDPYQVAQETWRIQANLSTPPSLNIRYPGQYYDFEAGLVQNWWRTYEPRMAGRYTSADPIGLNGGWNRFAYADGDGINGFDPDGLSPNGSRNSKNGRYMPNGPAKSKPGEVSLPDPVRDMEKKNKITDYFLSSAKCNFGFSNCEAEQGILDAFECATSICTTNEGQKFILDSTTCSAYGPQKTQCKCLVKRIRRGGNPNDDGRLPGL